MTKHAALCLALLALSACDSTEPTEAGTEDPIVGTWAISSVTSEEMATVSQTQTVLDASSPGTSTVRATGDEVATFATLGYASRYNDGLSFSLLSYDPEGPYPARPQTLAINDGPSYRTIQLQVQADDYASYANESEIGDQMTRDGWTYRFNDVPLVGYDGRRVTLSGAFTFATRTLTANRPSVLTVYEYSSDPTYRLDYVFGADGQFTVREGSGNTSVERSGTWTRVGDRVELRTPIEDGTAAFVVEYAVEVEGSTLTLTNDRVQHGCTGGCLQSYEQTFGIEPGTLMALDRTFTSRFTRGTLALARAADAAPGAPLPPAIREQLLLGPAR